MMDSYPAIPTKRILKPVAHLEHATLSEWAAADPQARIETAVFYVLKYENELELSRSAIRKLSKDLAIALDELAAQNELSEVKVSEAAHETFGRAIKETLEKTKEELHQLCSEMEFKGSI